MRVGVIFPQTEIGNDSAAIRDFAQAVEGMGYDHLVAYDHVLGADPAAPRAQARGEWVGAYRLEDAFHEVFVLFGFLAAHTRRLELATGVLILPQRQTALVAKQAAEVDVLTGGRLRLGVGVGWNSIEYEALGVDFRTRGSRITEQVKVLRALWTQESVTFHGRWHDIVAAGINPMPMQRPIPVWMGGSADAVLKRMARLADGWFFGGGLRDPYTRTTLINQRELVEKFRGYVRAAGRDPAAVGLEGRVSLGQGGPNEWRRGVEDWRALGATHLSVGTMRAGLATPDAHVVALRRFREATAE